ncbi:MAG: alpha-(1-_3)-arabinofuranosyltransferase family protein, partial [Myxococcota bacterium]|nr:alpha-(1->3)-arabinofuranosyltransferase family protein [Myxococcota bacterium]
MDVVKSHYGALGLYFVLAIVLTYPLCFSLTDTLIGHEQATAGCHVWVLWWAQTDMTAIKTPLIFFPYGGDVVQLYGSDLLSPLLLSWFPISPVLLYNVWILLLFILGAMGLRQLALHLGASYEGAFVGGVVFVSGPFFLHELLNGTSELLAAFFLPWFLLFLIRTYEKESYRNAVALGFFASLCLLSSVYNAFFVLLISIVWLLYQSMKTMEPIWTRGFLSRTAISLVVFSPALFLVAWLQLNHGATQTASRRETLLSQGAILPDSYASIEDWFNPT